jgi:short-subunit dehydrogenase
MSNSFSKGTALITGASSGIGAVGRASCGYRVALHPRQG